MGITEEFIREVIADILNEGYTSEQTVVWIKSMLRESWGEGYDAYEKAHKMSNYEPWEYVEDNPYL